jgi:hypothetical protein
MDNRFASTGIHESTASPYVLADGWWLMANGKWRMADGR